MRFVIEGPPRTKKNHQTIVRNRATGRMFVVQSKQAQGWEKTAVEQLVSQRHAPCFAAPVNMSAQVFRERNGRADLLNYLAAISDALERAGIVEDDKLIVSLDGCRLAVDRERPRVEVELTVAA